MSRRTNVKDKVVESRDYGRRPFLGKGRFGNMMRTLTDRAVLNVKKFSQSEFKKPYRNDEFNYMENVYNPRGSWDYRTPFAMPDIPLNVIEDGPRSGGVWLPEDKECSCSGGACCDPVTNIARFSWTCSKGKSRWYEDIVIGEETCAKAPYPGGGKGIKVALCAGECCSDYDLYKCVYRGDDPTSCNDPKVVTLQCSTDNLQEITPPNKVTICATGGLKNYTICGGGANGWTFSGAGGGDGCYNHWQSTIPCGTLTLTPDACGSGWVSITDKCGTSVRCTIRSTAGTWNVDSDCKVCGDRNNGAYHEEGECRTKQGYSQPYTGVGTAGDCSGCFAANPCTTTCGVCVPAYKPTPEQCYKGNYPCWYLDTDACSGSAHQYCYCPICTGGSGIIGEKWECA